MHCKFTAFIHPETHPQIFAEPLQCVRHWEGALSMADTIPAIILLSHPLGGLHGAGEDCRRSMVHPTRLHLVLWQLSPGMGLEKLRENVGGKDLKTNRMVHWLNRKKGDRVTEKSGKNTYL